MNKKSTLIIYFRTIVFQIFMYLFLFSIGMVVYKRFEPQALPGIEGKIIFFLIPLGLLTAVLWFPTKWAKKIIAGVESRPGRIFVQTIPVIIPVGIILYVIAMNVFGVGQTYTIDFGAEQDVDKSQSAYMIDLTAEGRISGRESLNGISYREVLSEEAVYFSVKSPIEPTNLSDVEIEMRFRSGSDLNITTTDLKSHYDWQMLYKEKLDNYIVAKRFGNVSIYSKDNNVYKYYTDIDEWILNNIPKRSDISLFGYELESNIIFNRDVGFNSDFTEINEIFRGDLSFLVYLKDEMNLTLGKQDLNDYEGADEYIVELYDTEDNLIFSDNIADDDITDEAHQAGELQQKSFSTYINSEGLYSLKLINLKGDKPTDSTITYMSINTNKIITTGTILPLTPCELLFNLTRESAINLYIWHTTALQPVTIEGTRDMVIYMGNDSLDKWVPVNLPSGQYKLSLDGDIYVSGTNFALDYDSYFYPYNYNISDENAPWVIITDHDVYENNGWLVVKKSFNTSELVFSGNNLVFGLKKTGRGEVLLDSLKVSFKR